MSGPAILPGKSQSQLPTTKESLGPGYIVDGPQGDKGGPGAILDPGQRGRLIEDIKFRIVSAEGKWLAAIGKSQVANLIKKDDDLPLFFSFMAETLVGQLFKAAKLGMGILRKKGPAALANFKLLPGIDAHEASDAAKAVGEPSLVSNAIKAVEKGATSTIEDELKDQSEERQAKGSYLQQLEHQSAKAWQDQREGPPGYLDDAGLIALYHMFSVDNGMTVEGFTQAILDHVAKYEASPASKIGIHGRDVRRDDPNYKPRGVLGDMRERSLRVVMETVDDESVRYMYYKVDDINLGISYAYEGEKRNPKQWNDDAEKWEPKRHSLDDFKPWREIEPDMLGPAILNNVKEWGVPYDTKRFDSFAKKPPASYVPAQPSKPAPTPAPALVAPAAQDAGPVATNPLAPPPTFMDLDK